MKPPKMPSVKPHLRPCDSPLLPSENAHIGLSVPAIIIEHGDMVQKAKVFPHMAHHMLGSIIQAKKSAKGIKKNTYNKKYEISSKLLHELEEYVRLLGVDQIGYTKVNPDHIFKDGVVLFPNAIVITMEMKHNKIDTAPSLTANKEIFRTYYKLGVIVNKTADFLRLHGYNAHAGPAIGGESNYVMLAQDAGLGVCGKNGLLITKDYGPSLRIAVIYTDIENLPFSKQNDHLWIKDFCSKCRVCVKNCPAKAIYDSPVVYEDGSEKHIDYKKCGVPFSIDYGCTLCVKNCIFFKSSYAKIKESYYASSKNR